MGVESQSLLMTCCVLVRSPAGSFVVARALLDSGSLASFICDRLSQSLYLPRSHHKTKIISVGGFAHNSPMKSVTSFEDSHIQSPNKRINVITVVVPKVTCDILHYHIPLYYSFDHLSDLELADPEFGTPGQIDVLLGVNVFVEVLLHGWWVGPPNSPVATETKLGWIIAGATNTQNTEVVSCHTIATSNDILKRFWQVKEPPHQADSFCWSNEECMVVDHFET